MSSNGLSTHSLDHQAAKLRLHELKVGAEPMTVRGQSFRTIDEAREKLAELEARVDYHKRVRDDEQ